jgi:excisionase family DNA binding protein
MPARRLRAIDITSEVGLPITTGELARVTGIPLRTIQRDITLGALKAVRRWQGRHYRIAWQEARQYAIRVCALDCSTGNARQTRQQDTTSTT